MKIIISQLTCLLFFLCPCWATSSQNSICINNMIYNDETVSELITVVLSTNPIPSIPETNYIYEALSSLYRIPALAKCKKIIVFDGIQPSYEERAEDYRKYKTKIRELVETDSYFSNTELVYLEKWSHLAGSIREALKHVTTPFVFFHQHDLVLKKNFDLNGIIASMVANPHIKYVRLNKRENNMKASCNWKVEPSSEFSYIPLCKSFGWTDQTHVARLEYYTNFVLPQCSFGFMEAFLNPNFKKAYQLLGRECHIEFGSYLYGDLSDGSYIDHTDGRKSANPTLLAQ